MAKSEKIDNYKLILNEARKWVSAGIISKEQLSKIYSFYKSSGKELEERHFNIVPILSIFGALMIGAGIILFFALNWDTIPKFVKVFSILAALVASYHIGHLMEFQKANFPKVGSSLIFLGGILFGSGIFLIGQIFHISSHWPNAFLFWSLGVFPLAYLTGSISLTYLGLLTALFYIGSETYYWFEFVDRYYNLSYAFFLVFLSAGVLCYMLGSLHEKKESLRRLRYPFHLFGSFLILLVSYLFSFKWFGREVNYGYSAGQGLQKVSVLLNSRFWVIYLAVSLLAIICIVLNFKKRDKNSKTEFYEIFAPSLLVIFTPVVVLFSTINFWLIPVIFNVILFLLVIGSVYLGYAKRERTLINLGMFAFGISVFSRYVEYLWDVLNGYLFFIIGGILLIFLAIFLEKKRRNIIEKLA